MAGQLRSFFFRLGAVVLSLLGLAAGADPLPIQPRTEKALVWPAPAGEKVSSRYRVQVQDLSVPVLSASSIHGGDYSFATFDLYGSVEIKVSGPVGLAAAIIRPQSAAIKARAQEGALAFTLRHPAKISIEPDSIHGPLLLFANSPENNPRKPGDAGIVYFGPGIHQPGQITLQSGQTLYLAGGAVVKGAVRADHADHIQICGRGILDGSDWPWLKGPGEDLVNLIDCQDVRVEGIILRGSFAWTIRLARCRDVTIGNVKILNSRVENDDGIDPCNSYNVRIEDCFIRTDDDCIALKGLWELNRPPTPLSYVTVHRCVLWSDRARIFLLGHESQAPVMEHLLFDDCDIVHYVMTPFLLEPGEQMQLRHARFSHFRIHGAGQKEFITLHPTVNQYMRVKEPGAIDDIVFNDITLSGDKPGPARVFLEGAGPSNQVANVVFDNVLVYGQKLSAASANMAVGHFVHNVLFGPSKMAPP